MKRGLIWLLLSATALFVACVANAKPEPSLADARQAIAAGKGDEKARFTDINQGSNIACQQPLSSPCRWGG